MAGAQTSGPRVYWRATAVRVDTRLQELDGTGAVLELHRRAE